LLGLATQEKFGDAVEWCTTAKVAGLRQPPARSSCWIGDEMNGVLIVEIETNHERGVAKVQY
jgi:hypothetical protein